jgi:hypothetical protein
MRFTPSETKFAKRDFAGIAFEAYTRRVRHVRRRFAYVIMRFMIHTDWYWPVHDPFGGWFDVYSHFWVLVCDSMPHYGRFFKSRHPDVEKFDMVNKNIHSFEAAVGNWVQTTNRYLWGFGLYAEL